jgi:hypothetical protein
VYTEKGKKDFIALELRGIERMAIKRGGGVGRLYGDILVSGD